MKRTAAVIAAAVLTATLTHAALTTAYSTTHPTDGRTSLSIPATCQEDDPCWDCHSLGNRVCGPKNDAERAAGWAVWDYANGAHSLKMDPSKPFRVDYVGNSIDHPRNLRENDLALVGKDGKWYVFRAVVTQ